MCFVYKRWKTATMSTLNKLSNVIRVITYLGAYQINPYSAIRDEETLLRIVSSAHYLFYLVDM